jgi:hypothetical protein
MGSPNHMQGSKKMRWTHCRHVGPVEAVEVGVLGHHRASAALLAAKVDLVRTGCPQGGRVPFGWFYH